MDRSIKSLLKAQRCVHLEHWAAGVQIILDPFTLSIGLISNNYEAPDLTGPKVVSSHLKNNQNFSQVVIGRDVGR